MANRRLYYACYSFGLSPFQATPDFATVRGAQAVGMNTTFNLEQIFEIGQLAIYENVENLPDVEVTAEKVLDGYPLIYHLATQGAADATLVGRSNQRCHGAISVFADTVGLSSGTPQTQCFLSGLYLSQVNYDMTVDGNARESVTLVGNNKQWLTSGFTFSGFVAGHDVTGLSPVGTGGVQQRQDFDMTLSRFPTGIRGISSSGTNDDTGSGFGAPIQSIRVSANLGRDQMLELGRKGPYFRYVNFPVEVTTAIECYCREGDFVTALEDQDNTSEQSMRFKMKEGAAINLGSKNRLQSVSFGGANAGARGGNATLTYNFVTQNELTVTHPRDPDGHAVEF